MPADTSASPSLQTPKDTEFSRHNYLAHGVEGGIFMGGAALVDQGTLLPKMIEMMGAPAMLIAYLPTIVALVSSLPQLFIVRWIETQRRMKPFVVVMGIFQRLPFLLAGLALVFLAGGSPMIGVLAAISAPLLCGLISGFVAPAWLELVARTVSPGRLSSMWAVRFVIMAVLGVGAGFVINRVLDAFPGHVGYGFLHLLTTVFLFVSYFIFLTIKEKDVPARKKKGDTHWLELIREAPSLIRSDPRLASYLVMRILMLGPMIFMPFLSIHVLDTLDRTAAFLGTLIIVQQLGMIGGNLIGGWVGDKVGAKRVLIISRVTQLAMCVLLFVSGSVLQFFCVYALIGFCNSLNGIGTQTLGMEICPVEKRVRYFAIQNIVNTIGFFVASSICAIITFLTKDFVILLIPAMMMLGGALYFLLKIEEPRGMAPARG